MEHNAANDEVTLTLRDDVTWSDGEQFTADDVAFTYNTVRENRDALTHTAEIHLLDRAEVVDDYTVRFHLTEPSPSMDIETVRGVLDQNPTALTFSGREAPYGYLDWCPLGLFINHAADNPVTRSRDVRWALNYAIGRAEVVDRADSGAGSLAFNPFTAYSWFAPYEERLQGIYDWFSLDADRHLDLVDARMVAAGYAKNAAGMWSMEGETLDMSIYASTYMSRSGVHIIEQLRSAGFNAALDRTAGGGA